MGREEGGHAVVSGAGIRAAEEREGHGRLGRLGCSAGAAQPAGCDQGTSAAQVRDEEGACGWGPLVSERKGKGRLGRFNRPG
jgi:hypothetical protein